MSTLGHFIQIPKRIATSAALILWQFLRWFWFKIALWNVAPKYSRVGFYIQFVMAIACVYCWETWPPVPTVAISFLGVVAVIMTVKGDRPYLVEKAVYVLIAFALFSAEMRAVYQDRAEHDRQQAESRAAEAEARRKEAAAFAALLQKGDSLFKSTHKLQTLAKQSLDNITGGESFAVVTPVLRYGRTHEIALSIRNCGKEPLTGMTVAIYDMRKPDVKNPMAAPEFPPISVGTLHGGETRKLDVTISPVLTESAYTTYLYELDISAQNFTVHEYLTLKKGGRYDWNFMYKVIRDNKTLKETKWNEY